MPATPASKWREINRKEVTLPSGNTVVIRKLTADFLFTIQEIAELALSTGERNPGGDTTIRLSVAQQKRYIEALVCEGVVEPKIVSNTVTPKDNELQLADLGADLDPLLGALNELNGDLLNRPFRTPEAGTSVPSPSDDVRGEPERVETATPEGRVV
jgi:hypothetical protein